MEALKESDMQTFTDILNTEAVEAGKEDPNFWVNSGRREDEGLNLGELAVVQANATAISTMARLGIPLDLVNPITGYSALHRAAELGRPSLLAQILESGRQDFDVNSKTSRRKRGLTPLHLVAAHTSKEHLACMDLLLANPLIDVNLKDVSWTTTPLYAAGKAKNKEGVVKLLEQGANPDIVVLADSGKTIRDFLTTWLPDLNVNSVKVKKKCPDEQNAREKLMRLAKDTELGGADYTKHCIQFRQAALGLADVTECKELFQLCCQRGLVDFVQALLRKGVDPDKLTRGADPDSFAAVLDAAERGDVAILRILKRYEADFTAVKLQSRETVLHCLLKAGTTGSLEDRLKCLSLLLSNTDEEFSEKIKSIINRSDINGMAALHYATEKWPVVVTRLLLQNGANIGIKNQWGEIPISRIPPDTMEEFLSEDCLLASRDKDVYHRELEITFNYSFLAPDPASLPEDFKPEEAEAGHLLPSDISGGQPVAALPETESLWYMGQSKEHRYMILDSFVFTLSKYSELSEILMFKFSFSGIC